jgi:hypothetical protein
VAKLIYLWKPFGKLLTVVLEGLLMTGLAEAGLIWSNLSKNDVEKIGKDSQVFFEPDRYCDLLNMS